MMKKKDVIGVVLVILSFILFLAVPCLMVDKENQDDIFKLVRVYDNQVKDIYNSKGYEDYLIVYYGNNNNEEKLIIFDDLKKCGSSIPSGNKLHVYSTTYKEDNIYVIYGRNEENVYKYIYCLDDKEIIFENDNEYVLEIFTLNSDCQLLGLGSAYDKNGKLVFEF